jgi:hypothetical protein
MINEGYDQEEIAQLKEECTEEGTNFMYTDEEPQTDDFVSFQFVGMNDDKEVIYDAVMLTLKMMHSGKIYEMAEEAAEAKYPEYKRWDLTVDEEGNVIVPENLNEEIENYKATIMMELEEDDEVKVSEYLEIDTEFDYGVGLEVCLNVDEITDEVLMNFVENFNAGTFKLDPGLYSFQHDDEVEGEEEE